LSRIRSSDERSDIRATRTTRDPAFRFAHAGYRRLCQATVAVHPGGLPERDVRDILKQSRISREELLKLL
jgi:hypothetical protein